jgi:hypothetical protein
MQINRILTECKEYLKSLIKTEINSLKNQLAWTTSIGKHTGSEITGHGWLHSKLKHVKVNN